VERTARNVVNSAFFQSYKITDNLHNIGDCEYFIFYSRINHSRKDNQNLKDKKSVDNNFNSY
jgi:hypothetical protein